MTFEMLPPAVFRCGIFLVVATFAFWRLLRTTRCRSSKIHRIAWFSVLFLGVLWTPMPVELPVLERPREIVHHPVPARPIPLKPVGPVRVETFPMELVSHERFVPAEENVPNFGPVLPAVQAAAPPCDFDVYPDTSVRGETPRETESPGVNATGTHSSALLILGVSWLSGVFVLLVFKTFVYRRLLRSLRTAKPVSHELLEHEPRLRILLTDRIGPALARLPGGPASLVPKSLWEEADEEIRRGVLRHELSHYHHWDGVKSFSAWILATLQWFNPAAWFALKRFHDAAEWRCDAEAYGNREESLAEFAESMLMLHKTGDRYVGLLQNFRNRDLLERIQKLTEHQTPGKESVMKHCCIVFCVILLLGIGLVRVELVAKTPDSHAPEPKASVSEVSSEAAPSASEFEGGVDDIYSQIKHQGPAQLEATTRNWYYTKNTELEEYLAELKPGEEDKPEHVQKIEKLTQERHAILGLWRQAHGRFASVQNQKTVGTALRAAHSAARAVQMRKIDEAFTQMYHEGRLDKLEEPFLFDFKDAATVGAVLKVIGDEADVEIFADWKALKEIGVEANSPAKLRLPVAMPLKDVLYYLEKQLGIHWVIKNGMLHITSSDAAGGEYITKSYYVGDLLRPSEEGQDFEPLMDYIETMVAPGSWGRENDRNKAEIMEYYANLSLVVRQTENAHGQIVKLLTNLRKYNDIQICFDTKILPLEKGSTEMKAPRIVLFSGQTGNVEPVGYDGDYFVQITPHSGKPVPPALAAKNEPFSFVVPKGTKWSIKAKAMKQGGNDIVTATVFVDGKKPETRIFHASPLPVEEEEYILTGATPQYRVYHDDERIIRRVYEVSDLIVDTSGKADPRDLIDLIQAVVCPESWNVDAEIVPEAENLVVFQTEVIHAEITDLLDQLRKLNDSQICFDVSMLRVTPKKPEEGRWGTVTITIFNSQTAEIAMDSESARVVRVKPEESTLLSMDPTERQREILVSTPKGAKLTVQGIVSADREHIRLVVSVDGKPVKDETFRAKPISTVKQK